MANLVFDFLHSYETGERRESEPANAYQYDEGHVLEAVLPSAVTSCEIHYWIRGQEKSEAYTPGSITQNDDGSCTVIGNIPNLYFETNGELRVYIVVTDGDASITTYEGFVHICQRSMPDDYVDDDPENEATRVLIEAQTAAATATAAAETCEEVLESIPEDYSQLSDDVSDLKDGLNAIYYTLTVNGIPNETIFTNRDFKVGETYIIYNNTSGNVNFSLNDATSAVQTLGTVASGKSLAFTVTTEATRFRAYFGATTVANETVTLIKTDTLLYKVKTDEDSIRKYIGLQESVYLNISSKQGYVYYPFKANDVLNITVAFDAVTSGGQYNVQIYDEHSARLRVFYGNGTVNLTIPADTNYLSIVLASTGTFARLQTIIDFSLASALQKSAVNVPHVFYVKKDGSGDFTDLVSAVNVATMFKNSVVYVGSGTYDILSELGETYLANVSSTNTTWGMVLKNNIHLIFASNSEVVAEYTGDNANVKKYLSVFNSGEGGFTLENCTIRSKNIRYCVHDDRGSMTTPYHNKYIKCNMYHDNSANSDFGGWQCIGGGFGIDGDVEIVGCAFDGHNQWGDFGGIVSYHNSAQASAKSKLTIRDCYFAGDFTVRVSWYGTSTEISKAYITGCRLGQEIVHQAETPSASVQNTEVIAWNNEIASV